MLTISTPIYFIGLLNGLSMKLSPRNRDLQELQPNEDKWCHFNPHNSLELMNYSKPILKEMCRHATSTSALCLMYRSLIYMHAYHTHKGMEGQKLSTEINILLLYEASRKATLVVSGEQRAVLAGCAKLCSYSLLAA